MADKLLTSAAWSAFAKKRELDDAALLKVLARLDKAVDGPAPPWLEALDDVEAQIKKLQAAQAKRKPDKAGEKDAKEIKERLQEMADAVQVSRKQAQAQADRDAGADEEADSPALLTSKMTPLLRELRKGEARMHAMVCTAGKNTAVLIMRRPIGPARRKLLSETVDAKGGAKFILAECLWEDNALTFVVQGAGAGLAKRLKQALLDQTAMRLKVRVRGDDGAEEDGEDGEAGNADTGSADAGPGGPEGTTPSPSRAAYEQRLAALQPRLDAALKAQHPEATKLRGVSGFASEKAAAGDYGAALKALDMLEKLLGSAAPQSPPQAPPQAGADAKTRYEQLLQKVTPVLEAALRAQHPESTKLRALSGLASEKAAAADHAGAIQALQMIDKLALLSAGTAKAAAPDLASQWKSRLAECMPAIKAALEARPPNLADISRLLAQANAQSKPGGDTANALALLEQAHALALAVSRAPADGDAAGDAAAQPAAQAPGQADADDAPQADNEEDRPSDAELAAQLLNEPPAAGPSMVALTKARLAWDSARKAVHADLTRLEKVILEAAQAEPDIDAIRQGTGNLYEMLGVLDEALIDILDEMLNAEDPSERLRLRRAAAAKIDAYADYVATDALVQNVDNNPFMPVKVRATLERTLGSLREKLT